MSCIIFFRRNKVAAPSEADWEFMVMNPSRSLPWEMFQGSCLLPSEPWALESGAICQEAIYLSSLLVGVKSDKTMLSEAVFTSVIGVKETLTGLHLFTRLPVRFVPTQTHTGMHLTYITVLVELERKVSMFLSWLSCLKKSILFNQFSGFQPYWCFVSIPGRRHVHSCLCICCSLSF